MYRVQHLFVLVWACDGEDGGVRAANVILFCAQATGYYDFAVFGEGFADGVQRFCLGGVQETACVYDHGFGACVIRADRVTFGAQAGQDAFRVHQCLGAAKGDHADFGLAIAGWFIDAGAGRQIGAQGRWIAHDYPIP